MAEFLTCYNCGIAFGVPEHWAKCRRESKDDFWCPNGHKQAFIKSTSDRLREEQESIERLLQAELNDARHAQLVAEKAAKSAVAAKRKLEKRIAHGVCPCCNQTFSDISNHMMTQHSYFRLPAGKKTEQIEAPW